MNPRRDVGVVTIDGPAASGKSSAARGVALALGVPCVSSGLLYRAATYLVVRAGVPATSEAVVLGRLAAHRVELLPGLAADTLRIDGVDRTRDVQTHEVDANVSQVAAHPAVREWVAERLREMPAPFVIDGRDMGSVVFPEAEHKFYLEATPEVRANRRVGERSVDHAEVLAAIVQRDQRDARQLVPAADADHLDTSAMTLAEVIDWVVRRVRGERSA
jgi:cytidylate kinase